ncbi:MAG: SpoIIE family protein phosphatase [Solobacterium sp.]|nr:SpoIIE family protein phosphatase [Solobacterium sp.]
MREKRIHVDAAWKSLNHYGEELCGDRVMIRRNDNCFVLVLADGLGSGIKANILSTLTSTIISEMVFAGMTLKDCVDTITATLPVCSERGKAYSTFTIIQVFYDGDTYLIQFDAPPAVIISEGKIIRPEEAVVEMAGERLVHVSEFRLNPGDYIVTFSDGILYAGTEMQLNLDWDQKAVEDFLCASTTPDDPAGEIVRILLAVVNSLYDDRPSDDSTVACVRIIPAKETVVMAGPPKDRENDRKVVDRLLSATDKKICCGGTTANIVSRILQRPVQTEGHTTMTEDVPPTSHIAGIDLVTEGVLTLQKTAWLIDHAENDINFLENLMTTHKEDGATLLAQSLIGSSAITFLLGLSENEAYAGNKAGEVSLDLKVQLVHDIAASLEKLGKITKIEEY